MTSTWSGRGHVDVMCLLGSALGEDGYLVHFLPYAYISSIMSLEGQVWCQLCILLSLMGNGAMRTGRELNKKPG